MDHLMARVSTSAGSSGRRRRGDRELGVPCRRQTLEIVAELRRPRNRRDRRPAEREPAAVFPLEVLQPSATGNEICMRPQVVAIPTCQSSIL